MIRAIFLASILVLVGSCKKDQDEPKTKYLFEYQTNCKECYIEYRQADGTIKKLEVDSTFDFRSEPLMVESDFQAYMKLKHIPAFPTNLTILLDQDTSLKWGDGEELLHYVEEKDVDSTVLNWTAP